MSYDLVTKKEREDFDRMQDMAYRAARAVLMLRRDPSISHPPEGTKLDGLLMVPARLITLAHFEDEHPLTVFPIMRGVWKADKEVGTEFRCWT